MIIHDIKITIYEKPKNPIEIYKSCELKIGNSVRENAPSPRDNPKIASIIM
jgi:hypothetical protein